MLSPCIILLVALLLGQVKRSVWTNINHCGVRDFRNCKIFFRTVRTRTGDISFLVLFHASMLPHLETSLSGNMVIDHTLAAVVNRKCN